MKPSTVQLARAAGPLAEAIARLGATDHDRRPFVIVEDTVTKKFVQYAGSRLRRPFLDVPTVQLTAPALAKLATLAQETGGTRSGRGQYQWEGVDVVAIGLRVLAEVHDLPSFAELRIREETTNEPEAS